MAIEEPEYEVLSETDIYEIRRYAPYIVAEVDVDGDVDSAGNKAFRILAGYIFGDNDDDTRMKMTAPVASQPAGDNANRHTYAFVMERKYTLESLPRPNDPRIRLSEIEPRTMAAVRYSGRWTEKNYRQHLAELRQALAADGVATRGEPLLARYNSPFTPWFLRRNEVLLELDD
ncbi:MAG: heme-binding protein [Gammaproteobacteria bacterium]|nr:heme-binding protein [Gammaproteobacteria bacterium]